MRKCRNNKDCNKCCYDCDDKNNCKNVKCYTKEDIFDYENCFFFLDTENIKIASVNTITDAD